MPIDLLEIFKQIKIKATNGSLIHLSNHMRLFSEAIQSLQTENKKHMWYVETRGIFMISNYRYLSIKGLFNENGKKSVCF